MSVVHFFLLFLYTVKPLSVFSKVTAEKLIRVGNWQL